MSEHLTPASAATSATHQRSPSMMIVVPILEDATNSSLVCDDLNASCFDYFQENVVGYCGSYDDTEYDNSIHDAMLEESPHSVIKETLTSVIVPTMMKNSGRNSRQMRYSTTTLSESQKSSHRRQRNRAITADDFDSLILPFMEQDENDYHAMVAATAESVFPPPPIKKHMDLDLTLPFVDEIDDNILVER